MPPLTVDLSCIHIVLIAITVYIIRALCQAYAQQNRFVIYKQRKSYTSDLLTFIHYKPPRALGFIVNWSFNSMASQIVQRQI